jgi:hypothetical protein
VCVQGRGDGSPSETLDISMSWRGRSCKRLSYDVLIFLPVGKLQFWADSQVRLRDHIHRGCHDPAMVLWPQKQAFKSLYHCMGNIKSTGRVVQFHYVCKSWRTSTAQPNQSKPGPRFATVAGANAVTDWAIGSIVEEVSPASARQRRHRFRVCTSQLLCSVLLHLVLL